MDRLVTMSFPGAGGGGITQKSSNLFKTLHCYSKRALTSQSLWISARKCLLKKKMSDQYNYIFGKRRLDLTGVVTRLVLVILDSGPRIDSIRILRQSWDE